MADLLVIVPALNEQAAIVAVVADTRRAFGAEVMVVDDGSDGIADVSGDAPPHAPRGREGAAGQPRPAVPLDEAP